MIKGSSEKFVMIKIAILLTICWGLLGWILVRFMCCSYQRMMSYFPKQSESFLWRDQLFLMYFIQLSLIQYLCIYQRIQVSHVGPCSLQRQILKWVFRRQMSRCNSWIRPMNMVFVGSLTFIAFLSRVIVLRRSVQDILGRTFDSPSSPNMACRTSSGIWYWMGQLDVYS